MTPEEKRHIQQGEFFTLDGKSIGTWYQFIYPESKNAALPRSTLGKTKAEVERNVDWDRANDRLSQDHS